MPTSVLGGTVLQKQDLPDAYWSRPIDALLADLDSPRGGLSTAVARERLARVAPNALDAR